jgi:hypothetical protein
VVVVVSAMSGETNRLLGLAHEIQAQPVPRELDALLSTGEQVTTALLAMALHKRGQAAKSYTGAQVRILTDDAHTKARIREIDDRRLHADLEAGNVVVVAGLPGCRRARQHHHARARRFGYDGGRAGGRAEGRRVPDLHRRGRRVHDGSAHRRRCAAPRPHHLRGNARDGQHGLEGAADSRRGVRRQVQRAAARAAQLSGRAGHADQL